MRSLLLITLRLYKRLISPLLAPSCRFTPTCSEYADQAIEFHGPIKGSLLTAWRLLRCHPFTRGGFDPVSYKKPESHSITSDLTPGTCNLKPE